MTRNVSTTFRSASNAVETGEIWLTLLTLDHPSLDDPIRLVNNNEPLLSRGDLYNAFAFEVELPEQSPESVGEATIRIDNTARDIITILRSIASPPVVSLEIVLASAPDVVEISFTGLVLRDTKYDAGSIRGTLRYEDIATEPLSLQMTPARFPGMF